MVILITIVHIAVCLFLIIVVLLQSGKSGDIAAAFGGMGSQTAFGPRGAATALSRATTWSAVIFMVTSITLSVYASRRGVSKSVLQGVKASPAASQPVKPAAPPAPVTWSAQVRAGLGLPAPAPPRRAKRAGPAVAEVRSPPPLRAGGPRRACCG